jgi:hypothetical protein
MSNQLSNKTTVYSFAAIITGRSKRMAKVTHLGSAKADDPIYSSGPQVFVPLSKPSTESLPNGMDGAIQDGNEETLAFQRHRYAPMKPRGKSKT